MIGEEPWFPKGAIISSLRLRTAYGFSGQHPGFQQAQTFYNAVTAFVPGVGEEPAVTLGNIGNGSLKPERSGELEAGFDAGFWHDRLNFQATGYSKATTNALVAVNLAPSIGGVNFNEGNSAAGFSTRFENLGQVDNRGLEMSPHRESDSRPQHAVRCHDQSVLQRQQGHHAWPGHLADLLRRPARQQHAGHQARAPARCLVSAELHVLGWEPRRDHRAQ